MWIAGGLNTNEPRAVICKLGQPIAGGSDRPEASGFRYCGAFATGGVLTGMDSDCGPAGGSDRPIARGLKSCGALGIRGLIEIASDSGRVGGSDKPRANGVWMAGAFRTGGVLTGIDSDGEPTGRVSIKIGRGIRSEMLFGIKPKDAGAANGAVSIMLRSSLRGYQKDHGSAAHC